MKIVEPSIEVTFHSPEGFTQEEWIEQVGRTCYKSEGKVKPGSAAKFVRMLRKRGHHAMLEHCSASVRIIADRGTSHELVRHRPASYGQESTRYCNYGKDKFGNEISVIKPPGLSADAERIWNEAMYRAEGFYLDLLESGTKPEIARSVLPIGLKTEIVITANLREFRHIFKMRCAKAAHPIIRGVFLEVLDQFNRAIPSVYEDLATELLEEQK